VSGRGTGAPAAARRLGLWMATAMVVGNMVGSGVFLLPAALAPFGWNGVAAWVITTSGAIVLAFTIGRLAAALPGAEGPVGNVADVFGPLTGALIGWVAWVSYWTASATVAIAAISYLGVFAPVLARPGYNALAASALIVAITLLNLRGARAAGGFQLVTTILKILPLIAVAAILIGKAASGTLPVAPVPPEGLNADAITTAAALTLWALVGFEAAGLVSDKIDQPGVTVPRATLAGTALTGIIYIIVCSGVVLSLPAATLAASDAPFALFLETYATHGAAIVVAAFAAISATGALNGFVMVSGEVPLTMARSGALPGWFGTTDANGTPVRMLIVSSALAIALVLANASKSTASLFTWLALLSTSATLWLYLAVALAAIRRGVVRAVAAIGAAYALWTLWGAGIGASGLSLILMASVLPFYALRKR
jgi:basic amino acid/polyamine antiporter, APA family